MITDKLATQKVQQLRETMTDEKLSRYIGISRKTLYNRLSFGKWKDIEKDQIYFKIIKNECR